METINRIEHERRPANDHSLGGILRELRDETSLLFRQEVELAKAEAAEKARSLSQKAVGAAVGGTMAYAGVIVLLIALGGLAAYGLAAAGVEEEVAAWLGLGIVGMLTAIIGAAMLAKAKAGLRKESLKPERTIQSLREDKEWTKEKFQRA
jgi:hypothetical protein